MLWPKLKGPYTYLVFVGIFAALVIVDRYLPAYRQLLCDTIRQTASDGPIVQAFCSPHRGPTSIPLLLILTGMLTVTCLAILPEPDRRSDIRAQADKVKALENPAEPSPQEAIATLTALWRELSIRAGQFRIVVLMSLLSPIMFFCFRGVDEVCGTHLLFGVRRLILLGNTPGTGAIDGEWIATLVAFTVLYSLLAMGIATFAVYRFSLAEFSKSQLAWRMAAGGTFYAGLVTLFGSILFAPTAWLTDWEYFVIRLTIAPVLAGLCALVVVSRRPADDPQKVLAQHRMATQPSTTT